MNRKSILLVPFVIFLAIILARCSRPFLQDQIQFGIWASEKDLWDEAIFRWKKAVLSNPNSVAAHNNLAVAYEKKGLWEEAKKEYELAIKLDPDNTYVKYNYENFKENIDFLKKDNDEKN